MKGFTTLAMLGTAALSAAQFSYNEQSNSFTCAKKGLAAYCAGGDLIIRCDDGVGYAGNCNDNLAGEPPLGDNGLAGCYQSSPHAGDAACTKAGLVYPGSGSGASNETTTTPYPIPGTVGSPNSTASVVAPVPTRRPSAGFYVSAGVTLQTVYTTHTVTAGCNGTQGSAAKGAHWSNVTLSSSSSAYTPPTPYLTMAAAPEPSPATPPASATTEAAAVATSAPSATQPTNGTASPSRFTGSAATSRRHAALTPYLLGLALFSALALF